MAEIPRTRGMMYVQFLDKLPFSVSKIDVRIKAVKAKRWAYIVHKNDVDSNGHDIKQHVHVMFQFENSRTISSVAKIIGDKPQFFENMTKNRNKNGINNGFSYLVHATENSRNKYQYELSAVHANFDYGEFMNSLGAKITGKRSGSFETVEIDKILDEYAANVITKKQATKQMLQMGGHVLSRNFDKLEKITKALNRLKYEQWRKAKLASNETLHVIWIYGVAGVGKTRLGKEIIDGSNTFITGGSNDPFQEYDGENVVVIDELRPNTFMYTDLLRMLDPWSNDAMTSARYKNKYLMADYTIVTTPYSPIEFYSKIKHVEKSDGVDQLLRRIDVILLMDDKYIYEMVSSDQHERHSLVKTENRRKNPYKAIDSNIKINFNELFER